MGTTIGVTKGNTRSLDSSSYWGLYRDIELYRDDKKKEMETTKPLPTLKFTWG